MKKEKLTKEQFIQEYIKYAVGMRAHMENNNYRKNNVLTKKFNKFLDSYEMEEYFEEALCDLMNDSRVNVKVSAACKALRYKIHIETSLNILKDISKKNYKFDSLSSEMVLKMYYGEIPNRKL